MATKTQHRIQVTETPPLQRALTLARARWPEEKRTSRLIERLAVEGANHLDDKGRARRAALRGIAAKHPWPQGPDYLEKMRQEDWPA